MNDYATYLKNLSDDEVIDIYRHINKEKYHAQFQQVEQEIDRRKNEEDVINKDINIVFDKKIVIDPSKYHTDKLNVGCMSIFWVIWAPSTLIATYMAIDTGSLFLYFWLIFGYLGTIGIPVSLNSRNRTQTIELKDNKLVIYGAGLFPWTKIEIEKQNLQELTLEHYDNNDPESIYSLNLIQKMGISPKRVMLAPFVHPKDKNLIFQQINNFLVDNNFTFLTKNELK